MIALFACVRGLHLASLMLLFGSALLLDRLAMKFLLLLPEPIVRSAS